MKHAKQKITVTLNFPSKLFKVVSCEYLPNDEEHTCKITCKLHTNQCNV